MAHDISFDAAGRARIVSLRVAPWHGLGTVVQESMSDDDILRLAGLDWDVIAEPLYAQVATSDGLANQEVRSHRVLRRSTDAALLNVVGRDYQPYQNREAVTLMRTIAGDLGLEWEVAGALGPKGDTVWFLARIPGAEIVLGKADQSDAYMLISNGHGTSRALTIMPTMVRVVCRNTVRMAEGGDAERAERHANSAAGNYSSRALAAGYSMPHWPGIDRAAAQVASAYRIAMSARDVTAVQWHMLAEKKVTLKAAADYWTECFRDPTERMDDMDAKAQERREAAAAERLATLASLWRSETNQQEGTAGTAFAAWQTVIEYLDHERPARSQATRWQGSTMGPGGKAKANAYALAFDL